MSLYDVIAGWLERCACVQEALKSAQKLSVKKVKATTTTIAAATATTAATTKTRNIHDNTVETTLRKLKLLLLVRCFIKSDSINRTKSVLLLL